MIEYRPAVSGVLPCCPGVHNPERPLARTIDRSRFDLRDLWNGYGLGDQAGLLGAPSV
jgi:hypothetical protein